LFGFLKLLYIYRGNELGFGGGFVAVATTDSEQTTNISQAEVDADHCADCRLRMLPTHSNKNINRKNREDAFGEKIKKGHKKTAW
jgi:hypothetical protein